MVSYHLPFLSVAWIAVNGTANILFAHSEEPADRNDEGIDLAVLADHYIHDLTDLGVRGLVDILLVIVRDRRRIRRQRVQNLCLHRGADPCRCLLCISCARYGRCDRGGNGELVQHCFHYYRSLEGKEEILIFREENASKFALFLGFSAPFAAQALPNLRIAMMIDDTARSGIVGPGGTLAAAIGWTDRYPAIAASAAFIKSNQQWPH
jgi:hypothetical protein